MARRQPQGSQVAAALVAIAVAHGRPSRSARRLFGRPEPQEVVALDPKSVRIHNDTEMALELLAFPKA